MINSCLVERISNDKRFAPLAKVLTKNLQKADELFAVRFDRIKLQRLVFETERLQDDFNLSNMQVVEGKGTPEKGSGVKEKAEEAGLKNKVDKLVEQGFPMETYIS